MTVPNNELWRDLIKVFKSEPCLWEITNDNYKNRHLKLQAWAKILEQYKKIDKNANVDNLKKKINAMRSCYRRELAKIKKSKRSNGGNDEVYYPTLWYFDSLDFLRDQKARPTARSIFDDDVSEDETASQSSHKNSNSECLFKPLERLAEAKRRKQERDDADIYAESWAVGFRKLSRYQQIYAKRGIEELLLHGQLGNLTMDSIQIRQEPMQATNSFTQSQIKSLPRAYSDSRASTPYSTSSQDVLNKEPVKSKRPSICIFDDASLVEHAADIKPATHFADIRLSPTCMDLPSTSVITPHEKFPKRLKLHAATSEHKPLEKSHTISGTFNQLSSIEENELDFFGRSIGCQLKKLPISVALQSMAYTHTYLINQRLKVIERPFEAPIESESL